MVPPGIVGHPRVERSTTPNERKYRAQHPILWWVAEFVMFIRNP
jgi:hypothetical protein